MSSRTDRIAHRRLALLGIVGTVTLTVAMTVTAVAYEGSAGERYSLLNHWISELGEVSNSELALLFNAGLVAGGLALAAFMVGLGRIVGHGWGGAIAVAGAVAGIAGALVGVFPMDEAQAHALVALTFFLAAPIAIGIFTAWLIHLRPDDVPRSLAWPGIFTVAAAAAFLTFLLLGDVESLGAPDQRPWLWPVAVLEWLTLIGVLAWTAAMSAVLWQGRTKGPSDR